jgi:heptosyltransferase-2
MNSNSYAYFAGKRRDADSNRPILLIPYMWIGDFVRCHTVVKLLRSRWPNRPVDVLTPSLCAPLLDYMPGLRKGIVWDLPRGRLPLGEYGALADRLKEENYGTALIMPRTWKAALAPFLAGIPERVGFVGEARFLLINDLRWGERHLVRMIDRCGALTLPKGAPVPADWPAPELDVPAAEVAEWRARRGFIGNTSPIVALAPGAVGRGKRWPTTSYAELARKLAENGATVWVLGGPHEKPLADQIVDHAGRHAHDMTGPDLRDAILALKAADLAVANDSGLMHAAAAIGTPTIGIFGPTIPLHGTLNPLVAAVEPPNGAPCPICDPRPCQTDKHRQTSDIPVWQVLEIVRRCL